MPRRKLFRKRDSWYFGYDSEAEERPLARPRKRRLATMAVFAASFFAGAAFTAFAGDEYAQVTQSQDAVAGGAAVDSTAATADAAPATSADPATTGADATAETAAPATSPEASPTATTDATTSSASTPASDPSATATPDAATTSGDSSATTAAPTDASSVGSTQTDSQDNGVVRIAGSQPNAATSPTTAQGAPRAVHTRRRARNARRVPLHVLAFPSASKPAPPPEVEGPPASATVWLNSALPDPTPPALRLSPAFARRLMAAASRNGIDWALALAIVRANGGTGSVPAGRAALSQLSSHLAAVGRHSTGEWSTALALGGSPTFADRVQALARYDRAVGLNALVHGLEAAKKALAQRILADPSISIYAGGRNDIAEGKVDVRVLAMIAYLQQSFGEVTVSCLISGHRLYARPGVISAHIYGRAVDIAALGGTSILGHQAPGGLTEQAVRDVLLVPSELMPKQVISLLGLGGPSFALADHYNHIHIGY